MLILELRHLDLPLCDDQHGADLIAAFQPYYSIHLDDVYYVGDEAEVNEKPPLRQRGLDRKLTPAFKNYLHASS